MLNFEHLKSIIDEKFPSNQGFYLFGSIIYGTNNENSDIDIVLIDNFQISDLKFENYDIQSISSNDFLNQVLECDIKALEGVFGPYSHFKIELMEPNWNNLRSAISQKSSHSFVKAKKKIKIDKNLSSGQKSLFHALRILDFGIQLTKTHKINNFSSMNHFFYEIKGYDNWNNLNDKFKPIYNGLHSEFKRCCPIVK